MTGTQHTQGLEEPPTGVLAGENVPRENSEEEVREGRVERVARTLKGHPEYARLTAAERRRKARRLVGRHGGDA